MDKFWQPLVEKVVYKHKYKYIIGWYNHPTYGITFKVTKLMKANDRLVAMFTVMLDDISIVADMKDIAMDKYEAMIKRARTPSTVGGGNPNEEHEWEDKH